MPLSIIALFGFLAQTIDVATERIDLVEKLGTSGVHEYTLTLPDRLRGRHFGFVVDRSVCKGDLIVNGQKLLGDDADEVFAFDRANSIRLEGCLERTPVPLELYAHPKVLIESAVAHGRSEVRQIRITVRLTVRLRNTLANSVAVSLESKQLPGWSKPFFLGPETTQTHTFVVRLNKEEATLQLELLKQEEAVEGSYRHIRRVPVTRSP